MILQSRTVRLRTFGPDNLISMERTISDDLVSFAVDDYISTVKMVGEHVVPKLVKVLSITDKCVLAEDAKHGKVIEIDFTELAEWSKVKRG